MKCGKPSYIFHEGIGMIMDQGIGKKIPLMICDRCQVKINDDADDPLSPEEIKQSKLAFMLWKMQSTIEYAEQEGLLLDFIGQSITNLQAKMKS